MLTVLEKKFCSEQVKFSYMFMLYFRVVCCTWNVKGTQPPDEDFRELLHLNNEESLPDVVAVG